MTSCQMAHLETYVSSVRFLGCAVQEAGCGGYGAASGGQGRGRYAGAATFWCPD